MPHPDDGLQVLVHKLNRDSFTLDALARADDFMVRATLEPKRSKRGREKKKNYMKFLPNEALRSELAQPLAMFSTAFKDLPFSEWPEQAGKAIQEIATHLEKDCMLASQLGMGCLLKYVLLINIL